MRITVLCAVMFGRARLARLDEAERAERAVLRRKAPFRAELGAALPEDKRPDAERVAEREETDLTAERRAQ